MKKQDISPSAITAGYLKRQRRYILTTGILLLLTLSLAAVMMLYGNTIYSPETVLRVLSGTDAGGAAFTIRTLRFPRMLTAILCGMACQEIPFSSFWAIPWQVRILSASLPAPVLLPYSGF